MRNEMALGKLHGEGAADICGSGLVSQAMPGRIEKSEHLVNA